jgi:hypothetical protein
VTRAALAALALAFALAHLPFVVSSLEDIDSVNFALAIRDFDVSRHRPHPPGYPLYVAMGKVGTALVAPLSGEAPPSAVEARTLSLISLAAATVGILLLYRVLSCWGRAADRESRRAAPWRTLQVPALAATALASAAPLFWYLAVRPMSDIPGLALALAAQAALGLAWWRQQPTAGDRRLSPDETAASGRMIVLGALAAGLSIGSRTQNALLTLPLLAAVLADRIGRGVAGALVGAAAAFAVGMAVWAIPLVVASGGIDAYLAALGSQAGEDFAGVDMLYLHPSPRLLVFALMRTFISPWDSVVLGGIVTALAAAGLAVLALRDRRTLTAILLVTLPYLAFHLLFQDTTFVRYALPLVPVVAFLAVTGLRVLARGAVVPGAAALAIWALAIAAPVLAAYATQPSPTVRALEAMREWKGPRPGALGIHQTFQRPLEAEMVPVEPLLPSPPRREWLELVKYWQHGRTAPLWFLADPRRTDLALIDPKSRASRVDFDWPFSSLSQIGGMRPAAAAWYHMPAPGWFLEDGWALTPETAGMARLSGLGPSNGPIVGWVRRRPESVRVLIGGRHLGAPDDPPVRFVLAVDGRDVAAWDARPGFFVEQFEWPAGTLLGDGPLARLTVWSETPEGGALATAIEQFDLQTVGSLMWAYDEGWHEAEFDPAVGLWRWTAGRATLRLVDASTDVALIFQVERPRRYFDDEPTVRLLAGDRVIGEMDLADAESWHVVVPLDALHESGGRVTIETSRTFVPAERSGGADRRQLGLRVFGVHVAPQP